MALTPGTRVGIYDLRSLLGEGGMGVVYRARDTKLERDVALKVLPDAFSADPERLARFEREAKVLATLNHPAIAQIYGFEDTGVVKALVMELVEGPTLADRIAQGPIPLDEALAIARQIADALEAAHEHGIVHRDLKPANVKVREGGTVKVLDFGLAKAMAPAGVASPGASQSPTITSPAMTVAGVILGTAAYMAPEQARGRTVDRRADIWAFGVVLFEMLTGTRPFRPAAVPATADSGSAVGESITDTLAAILTGNPNFDLLPSDTPASIRRLLHRCLEKDRRHRLDSAAAARLEIDDAIRGTAADGSPGGTERVGTEALQARIDREVAVARRRFVRLRVVPGIVIVAVASAVVAGALARYGTGPAPTPRIVRFEFDLPEQELPLAGRQLVTISPDGSAIAYGLRDRIYLRRLAETEAHEISGTAGAVHPVFSPDGQSLAFLAQGAVKRIGLAGGTPVTVCTTGLVFGMTWDVSGIVFAINAADVSPGGRRGVFRCSPSGGTPELLLPIEADEFAYGPRLLPGGKTLIVTLANGTMTQSRAVASLRTQEWDSAQIVQQSLVTGERTVLVDGGSDARLLPSGHLLFARGGDVLAVPFDATRGQVTGEATGVIRGVRRFFGTNTAATQFDVSTDGTLVYLGGPPGFSSISTALAAADRQGALTPLSSASAVYSDVRASRDGQRAVVSIDDGREEVLSIYDISGSAAPRRLTFGGNNRFPIWSPDGQWVAFQSDREGDLAIFRQRANGNGGAERLTRPKAGDAHVPESWSPDGRTLTFSTITGAVHTLWILNVDGRDTTPFGDVRSNEPIGSAFSPDGRWIAYHAESSSDGLSGGVFIEPFPPNGTRYQVPKINRDFQPVWSSDGLSVIFVPTAVGGRLAVVRVTAQPEVTFAPPELIPAAVTARRLSSERRVFDVLPDGRFIGIAPAEALDSPGRDASSVPVYVVVNWIEELKSRLASK